MAGGNMVRRYGMTGSHRSHSKIFTPPNTSYGFQPPHSKKVNEYRPKKDKKEKEELLERPPLFNLLFLIAAGLGITYVIFAAGIKANEITEPHCGGQMSFVLECTNVSISQGYHEKQELADFKVLFTNPYDADKVVVSKIPMEERETITLKGDRMVWKGTYNLAEKKGVPKTVITFHDKKHPENLRCFNFFRMECPALESMLEEKAEQWQEQLPWYTDRWASYGLICTGIALVMIYDYVQKKFVKFMINVYLVWANWK